jgi:membrane protein DedA with SNARE-associated domain
MTAMHLFFDSGWSAFVDNAMPIVSATLAALVGGLLGGFFVYWLTRASGQEAVRDAENEELRELLSALTKIEMYQVDRNLPVTR